MEYRDLGRRDYVNRRLRIKGRFISKDTAIKLLFGPNSTEQAKNYSFEQLKKLISEKFSGNSTAVSDKIEKLINNLADKK